MKLFVVALSLVVICSAYTVNHRQRPHPVQDYATLLGITSEERAAYNNFVYEPQAQNYAKCLFQRLGFIDQNGDFQESVAIGKLTIGENIALTEEQVRQCIAMAADNKAHAFSFKLFRCLYQVFRDHEKYNIN